MEIAKITENNISEAEKDYLNHLEMIQGTILQQKDGITVTRIFRGEHSYILISFGYRRGHDGSTGGKMSCQSRKPLCLTTIYWERAMFTPLSVT